MTGREAVSLDEFATAPRRRLTDGLTAGDQEPRNDEREQGQVQAEVLTDASKALRQMKRGRMKGASHFVSVHLDRETKRRLKLAAFNLDTSMQAIMDKAIRQYLDANNF